MTARRHYRWVRFSILAALAALTLALSRPAAAGDLAKLDTSLKLIPADAAFYSSMLRNREQFDAVKNSKAWARIVAMPVVQYGLAKYHERLEDPSTVLAQVHAMLTGPDNRDTVKLLKEMVSDEIFVYGDQSIVDFSRLFQIVNTAQSFGSMKGELNAESEGRTPQQVQVGAVLSALAKNANLIHVPNVVIGFRLKNTDLAKAQLAKLEESATKALDANEMTKGRLKKTKVGDHESLVLTLDGSMVPWDQIAERLKEMETEEGDVQKIVDQLQKSKLIVALCVRDNYLLVSIGSSLDCLEKLGKGPRLVDREEFKPLAKFVDKRLTSVGYVSAAMNEQFANQQQNVNSLLNLLHEYLPESGLNDQQKERVQKDAEALAADIKNVMPKPGATMGVSFLAEHGVEGYQYSWGTHGDIDGSKPLGLLEHVGGNPIFGIVSRQKVDVQHYDLLVKWVKIGYGYFKELVLPTLPEADREKAQKFLATAVPLAERLDKVNREMLFPALADGQLGLVFDAKLTSAQFAKSLPATEKPMPMIAPALVLGVSDAKLLAKAMGQYREIANAWIDAARQIDGVQIPAEIAIPEPTMSETSNGKIYSFALPPDWGVDPQIVPNFGLSDNIAVVSATRDHTERLLKSTPPAIGGLLAKPDHPQAVAAWLHWAELLDAAGPWVDFAVDQFTAHFEDEAQKKAIANQVHSSVDVLKVLRNVTGEAYFEDGALVTHTFAEFHDLGK
jgi:hypothetical protein